MSDRTPERAETQVGLTILAHKLTTLDKLRKREPAPRIRRKWLSVSRTASQGGRVERSSR